MAARDPERWLVVDNDRDLDATVDLVTRALLHRRPARAVPPRWPLARAEVAASGPPLAPPAADPTAALARFLDLLDQRIDARAPHRRLPAERACTARASTSAGRRCCRRWRPRRCWRAWAA